MRIIHRLLALLSLLLVVAQSKDVEESVGTAEIIAHWGYPVESYDVTTEDGYILSMQRIPQGRKSNGNTTCHRPPILLVHGIFMDSSSWVLNPSESSPGMILADAGFDVFLLSYRGTTGSTRHVTLNSEDKEFWKFTVDDFARYDAAAAVNKVISITGEEQLYWVGHSQGTIISYLLLAEHPEYNRKIRALFELAPAGTGRYVRGIARLATFFQRNFPWLVNFFGWLSGPRAVGFNYPWLLGHAGRLLCAPVLNYELCKDVLHLILGPPAKTYNFSRMPVYLSHLFVSTSSWNLQHRSQINIANAVNHFDHSPYENLKRYGQAKALPYDYSLITSDVYLFWSRDDYLWPPEESAHWTIPRLREGLLKGSFDLSGYNHLDFVLATDVKERIFDNIIAIARIYESNACTE